MIVLELTTPFDPGMYDQGAKYPHVLITSFNLATVAQVIEIVWEYGTMNPLVGWQSGKAGIPQRTILQNDDFLSAIAAQPPSGSTDSILMAAARECYTVLANSNAAPGTVKDIEIQPVPETAGAPAASSASSSTASDSSNSSDSTSTSSSSADSSASSFASSSASSSTSASPSPRRASSKSSK